MASYKREDDNQRAIIRVTSTNKLLGGLNDERSANVFVRQVVVVSSEWNAISGS